MACCCAAAAEQLRMLMLPQDIFWASLTTAEWAAADSRMAQVDNIGGSVQRLHDLSERYPGSTDIQTIEDYFISHLQVRICA